MYLKLFSWFKSYLYSYKKEHSRYSYRILLYMVNWGSSFIWTKWQGFWPWAIFWKITDWIFVSIQNNAKNKIQLVPVQNFWTLIVVPYLRPELFSLTFCLSILHQLYLFSPPFSNPEYRNVITKDSLVIGQDPWLGYPTLSYPAFHIFKRRQSLEHGRFFCQYAVRTGCNKIWLGEGEVS